MNTTNLFVELIVIGVGASTWIVLVLLSVFGVAWIPIDRLFSTSVVIPILATVYVIGIIFDRISDKVFDFFWSDELRGSHFKDKYEYYNARQLILSHSEKLSDFYEYGRSRMRICRGWTLNAILIAISLNIFLWSRFNGKSLVTTISIFGTLFFILFAVAAWLSWRKLILNEYIKIKQQVNFISK